MTLYDFNDFDEQEQIEAIWDKSVKLAEREDENFFYNLYQIDNFYVEEKFIKPYKLRVAFKTFDETDLLGPYLDGMKIEV